MRTVVIGLGVQGHKRAKIAGPDLIATVDPLNPNAEYKSIEDVPINSYDTALCCVPDQPKPDLLLYLMEHKKHTLVEKPLWAPSKSVLEDIQKKAVENKTLIYTAYNHRFEPHFVKMKELLSSGVLGEIYKCRLFYGNGTARLVRESQWRDQGSGVLHDLGSHLLDTIAFWFNNFPANIELQGAHCFENQAPDHVSFSTKKQRLQIDMEMSLLSWRNHFTCDIFAEKGSAHIESLCKWGPSTFTTRTRILPSGRPPETQETLIQEDPTWNLEYEHFKTLIKTSKNTNLTRDIWLHDTLGYLSKSIKSSQ